MLFFLGCWRNWKSSSNILLLVRFWARGLEFNGFRRRRSMFLSSCWERRARVWTIFMWFSSVRPLVCDWSGRWFGILLLSEGRGDGFSCFCTIVVGCYCHREKMFQSQTDAYRRRFGRFSCSSFCFLPYILGLFSRLFFKKIYIYTYQERTNKRALICFCQGYLKLVRDTDAYSWDGCRCPLLLLLNEHREILWLLPPVVVL